MISTETETASRYLDEDVVILSDNVHAYEGMKDFCDRHGLAFHMSIEMPKEHFDPGASIGLAI